MPNYSDLTTAGAGAEVAERLSKLTDPVVMANRQAAYTQIEEQRQKLQMLRNPAMQQLQQETAMQEMMLLKEENRKAMLQNVQQRVFTSLDRFSADNDVRHINTMISDLRKNRYPLGPMENVTRVDKLSSNDRKLLLENGYADPDAVLASPEAMQALIKVTNADGSVHLGTVDTLKAKTGYTRYATARELEEMQKRADIMYKLRTSKTKSTTAQEREAERVTLNAGFTQGSPEYDEAYQENYKAIVARDSRTAKNKDLQEVDANREQIEALASSYGGTFFDLTLNNQKVRREFEPYIEKMEKLGGLGLDTAEKKKLASVKQLIAIGNKAGSITSEETGLIDSFSNNIKKYVYDKISGIEANSAYAAYRNILRNALYGSVLTEGEMQAFEDQFGSIKQQTGPVLVQLKGAIEQLQGDIQALRDTGNSYVMHFRMGQSQQQLDAIIGALQERIDYLENYERGKSGNIADAVIEGTKAIKQDAQATVEDAANALDEQTMLELDALTRSLQ